MAILSFKAPISGKIVKLNTSLKEIALTEELSLDELRGLIASYEAERIAVYWRDSILQIDESIGITAGFSPVFRNSKTGPSCGPRYLKTEFFQRMLSTQSRGAQLLSEMAKIPIEEQTKLLTTFQPKNRDEAVAAIRLMKPVMANSILKLSFSFSSTQEFLNHIVTLLQTETVENSRAHYRYHELLTYLWDRDYLLFPTDLRAWRNNNKWTLFADSSYCPTKQNLAEKIYVPPGALGFADKSYTFIINCFASSTMRGIDDISPKLIEQFEVLLDEQLQQEHASKGKPKVLRNYQGRLRTSCLAFLKAFNHACPAEAVTLERGERKSRWGDTRSRSDGLFTWMTAERPEMGNWAECFRLFVKSRTTARVTTQIDVLNRLGDFLFTLDSPPLCPWEVQRRTHIYDARLINKNTYFDFLIRNLKDPRTRNANLAIVRQFFTWSRDYLDSINRHELSLFPEPILSTDSFGKTATNARTYRDSLPPYIINEMKAAITEDDYAFPRSYARAEVLVVDNNTGEHTRVFYPGLAHCLYTILELPIRSHQGRWLDSGDLDEFIYDPSTNSYRTNLSEYAIEGREQGAMRLHQDGFRGTENLIAWINTSKAGLYHPKNTGYEIPYVSPKLKEIWTAQKTWQDRYLPPFKAPLEYRYYQDDVRDLNRPNVVDGPTVCPLFRDPTKSDPRLPIDYQKLARFYTKLLGITEDRIFKKYGQKLKLITKNARGGLKWIVDLHSLRVSGITNLIEAGVPLEVVQMFVADHQVLVTTLHYLKYSPAKLREYLEVAHDQMINNQDFVGSELFTEALMELAPFLLTPVGAGTGAGIDALMLGDGVWTINPDGICPGTSCSNGGALENPAQNKYGPVPGGQRCGLCRFWITGPAHLLGQITAVNNLAYTIRKKGLEIARLNDACIDAEDEGRQKEARRLRDRVDLLNRELEIDVSEWASRYDYAQQSLEKLSEYMEAKAKIIATDKGQMVPVPYMTKSDALDLKITMEQSHEFALLDQITQLSKFTTGFTNREAEIDKHQILSKMMLANGISPFLLTLDQDKAHEAGNLLSALILQRVESNNLTDVLSGASPLMHYPALEETIKALALEASTGVLDHDSVNRMADYMSLKPVAHSWLESAKDGEDEEELFG